MATFDCTVCEKTFSLENEKHVSYYNHIGHNICNNCYAEHDHCCNCHRVQCDVCERDICLECEGNNICTGCDGYFCSDCYCNNIAEYCTKCNDLVCRNCLCEECDKCQLDGEHGHIHHSECCC